VSEYETVLVMANAKATHGAVEALPDLKLREEHKAHRMKDHDQAVYTAVLWGSYEYSAWTPRPPAGAGEIVVQGAIWGAAGAVGGWFGGRPGWRCGGAGSESLLRRAPHWPAVLSASDRIV